MVARLWLYIQREFARRLNFLAVSDAPPVPPQACICKAFRPYQVSDVLPG